jgi:hypothetical protein
VLPFLVFFSRFFRLHIGPASAAIINVIATSSLPQCHLLVVSESPEMPGNLRKFQSCGHRKAPASIWKQQPLSRQLITKFARSCQRV